MRRHEMQFISSSLIVTIIGQALCSVTSPFYHHLKDSMSKFGHLCSVQSLSSYICEKIDTEAVGKEGTKFN